MPIAPPNINSDPVERVEQPEPTPLIDASAPPAEVPAEGAE
jgi:hypothetical protein